MKRYIIFVIRQQNPLNNKIAKVIGEDKSAINRELK